MTEVVIGVDGGTTAVKAVAFDLSGKVLVVKSQGVDVQYGRLGEAEQDMNAIWEAVCNCLKAVTESLDPQTQILAVGLTGQGDGCWLIDEDGKPVRNAAIWMDGRAGDVVGKWHEDGREQRVLDVTGTATFPGLAPVLLDYFKEHEPETVAKAGHLIYCKDWLRYNLTGKIATDYTEASRSFFDVNTCEGFSTQLATDLQLADEIRLVPEVLSADGDGGTVSAEAAKLTGVPEGTPVGVGMIDVSVTGPGLGAVNDGDAWLILGTTAFVGTLLPEVSERRSMNSMVLATGRGKQVLEFMAPMTGTPNLEWIRKALGYADKEWSEIEEIARSSRPGSNGIIYLPYASPGGERSPFLDPNASASWLGMSISSDPADILRSVYEGVVYSLTECIDILKIDAELIVSGGGFRSDLVCEILASATGHRVLRQDAPEAGARGAAVLALVTCGKANDLHEAAEMLGTQMETFEPDPKLHQIYQEIYKTFVSARDALRPQWKALRDIRKLGE